MADMGEAQRELAEIYERLKSLLAERGDELAPYEERNALKALAALWQVANGLDLDPGQLYDLGA
ncbi:MAG TPA: hypothetical protein VF097_10915 [Actinomycetota bacterium]